jgi:RNA-binding protein
MEQVMALTKKQVKQLRGLATKLNPLIQVGKNDLSENAIKQADETIEKRELIKCSVLDGSGLTSKEAGEGLAEELNAELVQVIGNRFVLYRRSHRDDVEHIRLVRE